MAADPQAYPDTTTARTRWILYRRPPRERVEPRRPYAFLREKEPVESRRTAFVHTVFLSNRECPWRCLMCDLWRHTLEQSVNPGDVPAQIDHALTRLRAEGPATVLKLYNAGSFFDPRAIPPRDWDAVAERAAGYDRLIVESHPSLVDPTALRFRQSLVRAAERTKADAPQLEVALGLETVHPDVLAKLNKRMTLDDFRRAAGFLQTHQIALRVFVLLKPPFQNEVEAAQWAQRSVEAAFAAGAVVVTLIPVRFGNGALETLAAQGLFSPPSLAWIESVHDDVLRRRAGRLLVDVWDLQAFSKCSSCLAARQDRLEAMNLQQTVLPRIVCRVCGAGGTEPEARTAKPTETGAKQPRT